MSGGSWGGDGSDLRRGVALAAAEARRVDELLERALTMVGEHGDWQAGEAMLVGPGGGLAHAATWSGGRGRGSAARLGVTGGAGLLAEAVSTGRPVRVRVTAGEELAVPLGRQGGVLGVLGVLRFWSRGGRRVTDMPAELAEDVGVFLGAAIERLRATDERFRRATLALAGIRDPSGALQAIVDAARELVDADYAALAVFDSEREVVEEVALAGVDPALTERLGRLPFGRGVPGLVAPDTGPVRVASVGDAPAMLGMPEPFPPAASFLGVPVESPGGVQCGLYLANKHAAPAFSQDDEDLVVALAAQAGVAIDNARIHARDRELVERLDRANAELARASQAKSDFLASMSHELRTPLTTMLMGSRLLVDRRFGPVTPVRVQDVGGKILTAGEHLLALIDEMLDLSRIEAERLVLQQEPVELGRLFEELRRTIAPIAEQRHVAVSFPPRCRRRVVADRLRLRQVLLNLLANAVKFTEAGGRVWVEVKARGAVEISVHDTGVGIAPEDFGRIFEPFERVVIAKTGGVGLGLAISKRLVEQHGGRLEVASIPGEGSTFTVALPKPRRAVRTAETSGPGVSGAPAPHGHGSVLVVEDEPDVLALTASVLRSNGFEVVEAADLAEAAGRLRVAGTSVVLLDLWLGAEHGLDFVRRIRAEPSTQGLPVVAISADGMPERVRQAMAAGCTDYLVKPVDPSVLVARLSQLVSASGVDVGT